MTPRKGFLNPSRGKSQVITAFILALLPFLALLQGLWVVRHEDELRPFMLQFQIEKVDCDHCGGRGILRDDDNPMNVQLCPICQGVGSHQVRKLDRRKEALCPACAGMGRLIDRDGAARECRRCGGRGLIRIEE